ncbi:MAG: response regulator [Nanoarchaeota archaeon]|nr:response regulator [Nanoarchaeota archaeon]
MRDNASVGGENCNKGLIYVVEDEPLALEIVEKILQLEGYKVKAECEHEDAADKVMQAQPDLLLLDVMGNNGYNGDMLLDDIAKGGQNVATIVMSGTSYEPAVVRAVKSAIRTYTEDQRRAMDLPLEGQLERLRLDTQDIKPVFMNKPFQLKTMLEYVGFVLDHTKKT